MANKMGMRQTFFIFVTLEAAHSSFKRLKWFNQQVKMQIVIQLHYKRELMLK